MENKAKILLEQYEIDGDYPKLKTELLLLYSVSGSVCNHDDKFSKDIGDWYCKKCKTWKADRKQTDR